MKKNVVYASSLCAVAALLAFAACKKNSSSSSSSGSVTGAMGALNSLALSGSGNSSLAVKGFHPRTSPSCIPSTSGSITTAPGGTCSSGTGTTISGSVTETMSSCTASGYTESGSVTLAIGDANNTGSPIVLCTNNGTFVSMTGTFSLDSTNLTVSGNGVNLNAATQGPVKIDATMSDTNNTVSGTIGGTAFGQTIPSTSF